MKYLKIKNWENFQHYSKRNPPWIKLHRGLLRDYDFLCLQDASKLHLMLIWLLASQLDNRIPADANYIKNQIGVSGDIDFKELIDKGFLIDESEMLASCNQSAIPETETETETETNKKNNKTRAREIMKKPDNVSQSVWDDWIALRKSKKAVISENVIAGIAKKAQSIGMSLEDALKKMAERNWQGFEAQWIINETKGNQNAKPTRKQQLAEQAAILLEKYRD